MMKISASSPGRGEKLPVPLMRFVKGNAHSRSSRGRSRSSPLFFRKKIAAVETQEPSSPKVTCMGQVRVRRQSRPPRRCKWLRPHSLFCTGTPTPTCRPDWRRWVAFFQPACRKKVEFRRDCPEIEPESELERVESKKEDQNDAVVAEEKEASSSNTPPRNAFLLTRSRSAPYRSSSLASRFWGSEETEDEEPSTRTEQLNGEEVAEDSQKPTSENEPVRRDSEQESRTSPETEEKSEEGCSIRDATVKSDGGGGSVQPSLLLTRSKSEPARTAAAKLATDTNFWKLTRFADADTGS